MSKLAVITCSGSREYCLFDIKYRRNKLRITIFQTKYHHNIRVMQQSSYYIIHCITNWLSPCSRVTNWSQRSGATTATTFSTETGWYKPSNKTDCTTGSKR